MKKILFVLMIFVSSAFAQYYKADLLWVDIPADLFYKIAELPNINPNDWKNRSPSVAIAIVPSDQRIFGKQDTIWFQRVPRIGRSKFFAAGSNAPLAQFAIGDSVSAMITDWDKPYWVHGKVIDVGSSGRYLVGFKDAVGYDVEKRTFKYKYRREWLDQNRVEPYAYDEKYRK